MEFKEMGLSTEILNAIADIGFVEPTPIQQQAIPHLLTDPSDLIGLASTGTGKTASFGLPLLNYVDTTLKATQGLIICPTRELCIQISNDLDNYSKNIKGLNVVSVYGGTDINKQIRQIAKGAHVIVATPGRLVDLINRKKVKLNEVDTVILDEADEMLNMGFKEDIDAILKQTPDDKCVWLFSATMPREVAEIAKNYMVEPFEITVGGRNESNKNIHHHAYTVKERDRYAALKRLIDFNPDIYGLIFCRTRRQTAEVADKLMSDGYSAEPLHGDLSQAQRDRVMNKFRDKHLQILVATDVAARGIDVDDITHVIHYNLPEDVENYTHRSGRTARAGKEGISIALINTKEGRKVNSIEKIIKTKFEQKKLPDPKKIIARQLFHMIDEVSEAKVDDEAIYEYMPEVMKKLGEFDKEELVKKFVSVEFNKFLNYYANSRDLDASQSSSRESGRKGRINDSNKDRFFVNLGKRDGLNQGALLRLICDTTGLKNGAIGKIDILDNFSFFDADKTETAMLVKKMQNIDFEGKKMNVEQTKKESGGARKGRKKQTSRERRRRR
ncbi:MAG: DEAD/DEAH box helicase [Crocinitomicaceae bacterium]|nr:DEAD/DEAH box helicase [Crocinitomicaceae bacterium]